MLVARRILNVFLRFLIRILLRVEVHGGEHVPQSVPLIVMFNHINFVDGPLILGLLPRDTVPMTKAELFRNPIMGPLVWLYGAFGVRRGEVDRRALQRAEEVLAAGKALLFSPEGHRSGHGRLQLAKTGIAYIASRTGAAILPVAVTGQELFWRNITRLRRTAVRVVIAEPFQFDAVEERMSRRAREELTTQAMYKLASMLPPPYRGVYEDLAKASQTHLRPLTAPEP